MPKPRSWADLLPGLAALTALTLGAAAVLVYARVGALHGETVRLYAATPRADGILAGSEVWLGGQKIGLVDEVLFAPASHDTSRRVLLALDVLDDYRPYIRRRAAVAIKPGGSIIGARVVQIEHGAPSAPAVTDGDTLFADTQSDVDFLRQQALRAGSEVPVIAENVKLLASHLRAARGSLGALGVEGSAGVREAAARTGATFRTFSHSDGTLGRAMSGGALAARAQHAVSSADSLRAALTAGTTGTGGVSRGRAALQRSLASIQAELADVQRLLDEPRGTAGRAQRDRALQLEVTRARSELAALAADVQRNPLRYINF